MAVDVKVADKDLLVVDNLKTYFPIRAGVFHVGHRCQVALELHQDDGIVIGAGTNLSFDHGWVRRFIFH